MLEGRSSRLQEEDEEKVSLLSGKGPKLERKASLEAVARLRESTSKKSCAACGCDLFSTEQVVKHGLYYHGRCLRCAGCGRSVADVPFGLMEDLLYCDESGSGRSCLQKARQLQSSSEEVLREAENQRLSDSDVADLGRAKGCAVDLIGDDLEKIVRAMAPTCAVCGSRFLAKDAIVMQGMVKFHESCAYFGGPSEDQRQQEVPLDANQALREAPQTLLFKVHYSKDATKKVMTFFGQRRDDSDFSKDVVIYDADAASRAPRRRKCSQDKLRSALVRVLGTTGNDLAPDTNGIFHLDDLFRASFNWRANLLTWSLVADFHYDTADDTIAFQRATLAVTPVDE